RLVLAFSTLMAFSACFTPAKERALRDEIFSLQTRVMQLESALMDENTPAGEAAKRRLASTATDIEKLNSDMNRLKGELDAVRIGASTGFMPGVEGDQANTVGGKLRDLTERMASLEANQGDVISALERQGVDIKGGRSSRGNVSRAIEKNQDKAPEPASEESPRPEPESRGIKSDSAKDIKKADEGKKADAKGLGTVKQFREAFGKRQFKRIIEDAPPAIKAASKPKDKDELFWMLAESHYKLGQMREAALQYNEFIDSKPAAKYLPQARLRMGDAFRNLGDPGTAKIYYQELITKHPKSPEASKAKDRLKELGKTSRAGH
ncbi:MAG: hypothetical protein RIQ81_2060, partial [Pseudomonadota bacterium]